MTKKQSEIFKVAARVSTPKEMQIFLRNMPYNKDDKRNTLRSAESSLLANCAHCFEAAFIAAAVLEMHGWPPIVVSIESKDHLDHVLFVFQKRGLWGAIGRSRDPGLHGRAPRYHTLRSLVWSYFDPYIDLTGRITGYQVAHLDELTCDWRYASRDLWSAEDFLNSIEHIKIKSANSRYGKFLRRYKKLGPLRSGENWW